jgi:hypothetical protein
MEEVRKDFLRQELRVGDRVVYAPGGSYSGLSIGIVEKFTPKSVGVKAQSGGRGKGVSGGTGERLYYCGASDVLRIENN